MQGREDRPVSSSLGSAARRSRFLEGLIPTLFMLTEEGRAKGRRNV